MERVFCEQHPDGAVVFADIVDDRVVIQAEMPFDKDVPNNRAVHNNVHVVALAEWDSMPESLRESYFHDALQSVRRDAISQYHQSHPITCEELKRQSGLTATCCSTCHAEIASGAQLMHEFPYLANGQLTNVCCRIEQARLHRRKDPMTDEELAAIAHRVDSGNSELDDTLIPIAEIDRLREEVRRLREQRTRSEPS